MATFLGLAPNAARSLSRENVRQNIDPMVLERKTAQALLMVACDLPAGQSASPKGVHRDFRRRVLKQQDTCAPGPLAAPSARPAIPCDYSSFSPAFWHS